MSKADFLRRKGIGFQPSAFRLGNIFISPNPSLRAQRSNPYLLANLAPMARRVAALLAMTG
jgi:hypothetical protein